MTRMAYRIEANNKQYTGTIAGVTLVNGVARVDEVPEYFRRHAYRITPAPEPPQAQPTRRGASK